jgi:transmembrane sensor
MEKEKVLALLAKYKHGLCTEGENAAVETWYNSLVVEHSAEAVNDDLDTEKEFIWKNVQECKNPVKTIRLNYGRWVAIAATVVVIFTVGLLFFKNTAKNVIQVASVKANVIKPGKNSATLTLSDGKKILLSEATNGKLTEEEGVTISKSADGKLIYNIQNLIGATDKINTISTAKGETYQLRLPDGTNIWLNASSNLTYTTVLLKDGVRNVKLEGEAYFEVAKDKQHPFIVKTGKQQVEVLGTHFNINAYADDALIKTTLLQGAVKIYNNGQSQLLKPGQQAEVGNKGINLLDNVDVEEAVAWKNGDFQFNENLESIMAKIARWYDVEVVYQNKPATDLTFSGKISRSRNISGILKMLEYNGDVHFKVEGRRVTVTD